MAETNTKETPTPNEPLVSVFDSEQESEALVVRGLLESAGIDADLTSRDAQPEVLPGVGSSLILVRAEDAEKARSLIQEYKRPVTESLNADEAELPE